MEMNNFVIPRNKGDILTTLWTFVVNIAVARFEYLGIDVDKSDIDIDDIERAFLRSPYCAISLNKDNKLCALPCIPTKWNYKRKPEIVTIYSLMNDELKFDIVKTGAVVGTDCIVIENNEERIDTIALVTPYIERLNTIWLEHGNNLMLSKAFLVLFSDTLNNAKVKELVKELYTSGAMIIQQNAKKGLMNNIDKFALDIPYKQEQFHKDFDETFIKMLNVLGINTPSVEKRERLLVDEVNANNALTKIIERSSIMYREQGLKRVNKLYGVNFSVKPIQLITLDKEENEVIDKGEDENVQGEVDKT
jgi:hypothetical protein